MDFLDPVKKRAHTRRLFLGYFLIGVVIILASLIFAFLSYGYDVDRKTGELIQNGLIFADTAPESATIYLNGKENGTTDKRMTVPAGPYNVEFRRTGYRTWKKSLQLEGSSIERLVYPRLFPSKLVQAESATYDTSPTFSTQSPDRRWIIIGQPDSILTYQLFDTDKPDQKPTSLQLPAESLTTPIVGPQKIELVEWSTDNKHVLLSHTYGDSYEFIMVDREDAAKTVNLNKLLSINPTKLTLRDKQPDEFYVYDGPTKSLSQANLATKQITPLLSDVTAYKSYQADILLYATQEVATPGKTNIRLWDDGKILNLHSHNETDVLLDLARFDGNWWVAVVPVKEGRTYIYKDPFSRLKDPKATSLTAYAVMKIVNPQYLSFSANTRFIATQAAGRFAVYDLETNRRFNYDVTGTVAADNKAAWMDGHRLLLNQDNKVVVWEFDSDNRQELSAMLTGSQAYFDRDFERLYTLTPAKDDAAKTALTRTSLKLNLKP